MSHTIAQSVEADGPDSSITPYPKSLHDITPKWLSLALGERYPGVRVASVRVGDMFEGSAQKGIIHVTYDQPERWVGVLPTSFCIKGGFDRPHAEMGGPSYIVESRVYRDILPALPGIRAPRVYWVGIDLVANQGVQLLEDMSNNGTVFSRAQTMSFNFDEMASFLSQLAELHGYWWQSPRLRSEPWVDDWLREGVFRLRFETIVEARVAQCLTQDRGRFVVGEMRDPAKLYPRFWQMVRSFEGRPEALIHCDAHFGNTYRTAGGEVGILDWQAVRRGPPMHDVTFAIINALTPDDRRAWERDLISHYLAEAKARGCAHEGVDAAWRDYRKLAVYGFSAWLTTPLDYQPEEVSAASFEKFAAAVVDLDSYAAIGG